MRNTVFISYCHTDSDYKERLKIHLTPLAKAGGFEVWDDRYINPGDQWRKEIDTAMKKAFVAILFISADFFNSDFIINRELPYFLENADKHEVRIIPIILYPVSSDTLKLFELD